MMFTHEELISIVMNAIARSTLEVAAFKMEETAHERAARQLRAAVEQLQSLTSISPSLGGENYYEQWPGTSFASCNKRFGFKETVPAFSSLRDLLSYILPSPSKKPITVLERGLDSNVTRPMLTHGDLAPHNIIVDQNSGTSWP